MLCLSFYARELAQRLRAAVGGWAFRACAWLVAHCARRVDE